MDTLREKTVNIRVRNAKELCTGGIYIAFGLSAVIVALDYDMGRAVKMGPAYFPTVLGGLLILVGIISVARSFLQPGTPIGDFTFKGLTLVMVSVIVFGLIVKGMGLAIALPVLVMISAFASHQFRWVPSLSLAAGLTLFCVLVFIKGLGVPLPILGLWLVR
jgi:putative tricarboxylic transport membrane protein